MNKKRGLSIVITTLIMILLVLVAIGVVWVVIKNILDRGSEEISIERLTINLQIERVLYSSYSVDVTVKRGVGSGELSGINFVLSDGDNSETIKERNVNLAELGSKTFSLDYDGIVKKISIAPIVGKEADSGLLGTATEKEFSDEEIIENLNPVSWWRFNGNTDDEMGGDNCIASGSIITDGKYGQAYNFDGVNDYLNCGNSAALDIKNALTISAWVKPNLMEGVYGRIANKGWAAAGSWSLMKIMDNRWDFATLISTQRHARSNSAYSIGEWVHLAGVFNGTSQMLYVNGIKQNEVVTISPVGQLGTPTFNLDIGGTSGFFNGTIDEVMIFDKALKEQQVEGIYNLDLS